MKLGLRHRVKERNAVDVVSTNGGERRLCVSQVVEMSGHDSVTEGIGLDSSDFTERLEIFPEVGFSGGRDWTEENGAGG